MLANLEDWILISSHSCLSSHCVRAADAAPQEPDASAEHEFMPENDRSKEDAQVMAAATHEQMDQLNEMPRPQDETEQEQSERMEEGARVCARKRLA